MTGKIPWWRPVIEPTSALSQLASVVHTDFPNEGIATTQLEAKLASLLGVKHVIMTTSGTAALFLAMRACGVGPGDEVIVPDLTFIATANAVRMAGARPVLVDVGDDLTISVEAVEQSITDLTKAIIPVHLSGRSANSEALSALARRHRLSLIEDAAQAFMSKCDDRYLGTLGRVGCFSLSAHKLITSGQGGFVATNDNELTNEVRLLKNQGQPHYVARGTDLFVQAGYNFKYTDLQAAFALNQLESLNERIHSAKIRQELYESSLKVCPELQVCPFQPGAVPLWTELRVESRAAQSGLVEHLEKHSVECRKLYAPLHLQPPYSRPDTAFQKALELSPRSLWLPSGLGLSVVAIHRVCTLLEDWAG